MQIEAERERLENEAAEASGEPKKVHSLPALGRSSSNPGHAMPACVGMGRFHVCELQPAALPQEPSKAFSIGDQD